MIRDRPQRGNPHRLTINQHVFPSRNIERFADIDGTISVQLVSQDKRFKLRPDDPLFCANRKWDQRAEEGYMKEIEDQFQDLAENIVNSISSISPSEYPTVANFFSLWHLRARLRDESLPPQYASGMFAENLTKDQEEILERKHCAFVCQDQTFPERQILGLRIQMEIDWLASQLKGVHWGILKAMDGEFMAPDTFGIMPIVPLSPSLCLVADHGDSELPKSEVAAVNRLARSTAARYCIARNFATCPE